jgi:hypothetical protein
VCHELLHDARLYDHLLRIDRDIADKERRAGCPCCGGRLDAANYPRKPRGGSAKLPADYEWRFSFCCAECRRRSTPPSVRFFGRRVYLAPVFVVISAMHGLLTAQRLRRIAELVGADRRTVVRWRRWWRELFPTTSFWRAMAARFVPAVALAELAGSLLERFCGSPLEQLVAVLRFLSPLSTSSPRAI